MIRVDFRDRILLYFLNWRQNLPENGAVGVVEGFAQDPCVRVPPARVTDSSGIPVQAHLHSTVVPRERARDVKRDAWRCKRWQLKQGKCDRPR